MEAVRMRIMLAALIAVCFTFCGCSALSGVSVGKNYVGYENDQYKALVENVPTNTKQKHFRTTVEPKQGQKVPQITGDLVDTPTGGKAANIYIN
jgi:hypothetical protein